MSRSEGLVQGGYLLSARVILDRTIYLVKMSWRLVVACFLPVFLLFVVLAAVNLEGILPFSPDLLTRDPLGPLNLPFYYGLFSNLGVMLWTVSMAVSFLGAAVLGRSHPRFRFMICSGAYLGWLALDDVFMFHENVFPVFLHIPENAILTAYVLLMIVYICSFAGHVLQHTNYVLLAAALTALAASVLLDAFQPYAFIEDGAKIVGIILLAIYYFDTARTLISVRLPAAA